MSSCVQSWRNSVFVKSFSSGMKNAMSELSARNSKHDSVCEVKNRSCAGWREICFRVSQTLTTSLHFETVAYARFGNQIQGARRIGFQFAPQRPHINAQVVHFFLIGWTPDIMQ